MKVIAIHDHVCSRCGAKTKAGDTVLWDSVTCRIVGCKGCMYDYP